jgi:hypothetical protein
VWRPLAVSLSISLSLSLSVIACKATPPECPLANQWSAGEPPSLEELLLAEDGTGAYRARGGGDPVRFAWHLTHGGLLLTVGGADQPAIGFRVETTVASCVLHLDRPPVTGARTGRFQASRRP